MDMHDLKISDRALPFEELIKLYPHDVTFYREPPSEEIQISELEDILAERISVLMAIKSASDKGYAYFSDEWKKSIQERLRSEDLNDYWRLIFNPGHKKTVDDVRRRRKDYLSHCVTLLGFCDSEEKRQWITNLEMNLFNLKFQNLSESSILEFIRINNFPYKSISKNKKQELKDLLIICTPKLVVGLFDTVDFYEVPFTVAVELIGDLSCLIWKGYAYVPHFDLGSILETTYRCYLQERLALYNRGLKNITDPRVMPLIRSIGNSVKHEKEYVTVNEEITVNSLESLSKTSFPLCARNLYEVMKRQHHLKYNGRQQLQLFLKGIGLSVQGCLEFFRTIFTKKIDSNKFEKEYAYNIRHNYGLEGSKINYNPPSCLSIISSPVHQGEYNGCPFRVWDQATLKKCLTECGVSSQGIAEICDLAKGGHAQLACSKYFEHTHGGTPAAINHPNQYFEESRKYYESQMKSGNKTNVKK